MQILPAAGLPSELLDSRGHPCPKCGGVVQENYRKFQCQSCDFAIWKTLCGRMFEPEEVETLITAKQIGPLQGFMSKKGFPFASVLKMNAEHKIEFAEELRIAYLPFPLKGRDAKVVHID